MLDNMLPESPQKSTERSPFITADSDLRSDVELKLMNCQSILESESNIEPAANKRFPALNVDYSTKSRQNSKEYQAERPTYVKSTFPSLSIELSNDGKRRESVSSGSRSPHSPITKQITFKKPPSFTSQHKDGSLSSEEAEEVPLEGSTSATSFKKHFPSKDECYTDKDRAASVVFGTKDIKVSLQDKREREIRKMKPGEKKSTIYFSQGEHEIRQGNIKTAIQFFNKALHLNPVNKDCLIARSKCFLELGNSEAALRDAETALAEDKECVRALYQKAEALFSMGKFEYALVFFHRGHKIRPEMDGFTLGIQKAQKTIDNSVGKNAGAKLGPKRGSALKRGKSAEEVTNESSSLNSFPPTGKQKNTKKIIGELSVDKIFLQKFLRNRALFRTSQPETKEIREHARSALEFLELRQQFWHQQKPLYTREHHRRLTRTSARACSAAKGRGHMIKNERCEITEEKRKQQKHQQDRIQITNQVMKMLKETDDALSHGRYKESLNKCNTLKKFVDRCSEELLPNKTEILATIYSDIGCAHMELGDYGSALKFHYKDLELGEQRDLEECRSRALDNIGRTYALRSQFDKAIEIWEKKIPLCSIAVEKAWLHHEIGRCYLELNNEKTAKEYGQRSLECASEVNDSVWQLNSSVLIAQAEVLGGNLQGAVEIFNMALTFARKHKDSSAERAIKIVRNRIVRQIKENKEVFGLRALKFEVPLPPMDFTNKSMCLLSKINKQVDK
ncbi:outer dynein arm-docking complex subunit 4-like isoform X2 [Tachypleus tridentatus]|uniref:outer dynein arm-docking complex subunit 4-like isoform X2 n=1 Tax=Tachypleus tridentatus TaxID=6853 RepID=UPI003FD12F59